ncbi:Serine/threonine protein phosphatase PrpC [Nocardia amikacinitolerans]|nr:Serine/threonine protein phosphatase PrpC [Nocardia amikacinitolerans]
MNRDQPAEPSEPTPSTPHRPPAEPDRPAEPRQPVAPDQPTVPVRSDATGDPTTPDQPATPTITGATNPTEPGRSAETESPTDPSATPPDPTSTVSAYVTPPVSEAPTHPADTVPTMPLAKPAEPPSVSPRCPDCRERVSSTDRYCEACGRELGARRVALPHPESESATPPPCDACGAQDYDPDGYCRGCGQLRAPRDRFEADLGAVCVVTDRGVAHARNEDSVAAAVVDGGAGPSAVVIVVCDGVSTSEDPQAASGTASRSGVDATLAALAEGQDAPDAALAGLAAAAQAVRDIAVHESHAPSCTYVSAIVRGYDADTVEITVANVGDSRGYWLVPAPGAPDIPPSQRLTVDDSWAQALVDAGAMDEQAAMKDPRAHTLLRWLGADSGDRPWSDTCVRVFRTRGPGLLLLCSDGLWNYQPDAHALAALATAAEPMQAARDLAEFALRSGGSDNITVALARVP